MIQTRKAALLGWITVAIAVLLFVTSATLRAEDEKKKEPPKKREAPAATHEAAPATSRRPASAPASGRNTADRPDRTSRPERATDARPARNNDIRQERNTDPRPARNTDSRPARNADTRPARANDPRPDTVTPHRSGAATDNRPARATDTRPGRTPEARPAATPAYRPDAATTHRPGSPYGNRPDASAVHRSATPGARPGTVTRHSNGRVESYHGANNTEARFRSDGHVREVHRPGLTIVHSSVGPRRVVMERPDHTVIVTHGAGRGYVQRPFVVHNQTFVQRTYYVNNRAYVHAYRPYVYRGVTLHVYAPARYYSPAFYGWAYSPWRTSISFRWGWMGSPWYGYYGGYFRPYPVYARPSLWLTDFMIAATLEAAYQERLSASVPVQAPYGNQTVLTPEVKDAIADEVQRQLDMERAEAQNSAPPMNANGLPAMLGDNSSHVFVVSRALDVPNLSAGGQECLITEGDVLQLNGAPQNPDSANVAVLASKGQDCRRGSVISVSLQDLTEMQNQMRETIDQGLEELRSKQGQGGLPSLPRSIAGAPVQASFASALPPPDSNVAAELSQQTQEANQAEQEVVSQASAPDPGNAGSPATITLGMSLEDVSSIMGAPKQVVDLGAKKIYVYQDMKVVFQDGRVSDVQI